MVICERYLPVEGSSGTKWEEHGNSTAHIVRRNRQRARTVGRKGCEMGRIFLSFYFSRRVVHAAIVSAAISYKETKVHKDCTSCKCTQSCRVQYLRNGPRSQLDKKRA